jgi:transaldolase/glucose-6-phosphate isomerase
MNPVQSLNAYGQSVWLDYIRRGLLDSGALERLIARDGISGVTSNPAIFQKAIAGSTDYREAIAALAARRALGAEELYEHLAVEDIRRTADLLQPVHGRTDGGDGYVSLEVSPRLARDTQGTLAAARRLWKEVDRPNLMIKVPATAEGLPAFEELIAEGINVNVTLLFSLQTYGQVVEHYLRGLERRLAAGHGVARCTSVASFFLSRIDTAVDGAVDTHLAGRPKPAQRALLEAVRGRTAVACARLAYQRWKSLFQGPRWGSLTEAGARPQRLLWASTSTKNPIYSELLYVESLVGPDTVNTLPPATLDALRDHGRPRPTLEEDVECAQETLENLDRLGFDLAEITDQLLEQGLEQFQTAYTRLLDAVAEAREGALGAPPDRQSLQLPRELSLRLQQRLEDWRLHRRMERLWVRDPQLWTGDGEDHWLDWLDIVPAQLGRLADLHRVRHLTEGRYFRHAVLLGMGGSSLAPEMLSLIFDHREDHPELLVLDTTDPDQIRNVEARIDLTRSLFFIASKSGSTLEPSLLGEYFFARLSELIGEAQARDRFFAITDPGSPLEAYAGAQGFRKVFHGRGGIGGRYSALSDFGMVPAALLGMDLERFLERAAIMVEACAAATPAPDNPGLVLGLTLGAACRGGWNKLTWVVTPAIAPLGAWLEQLLAESTGKQGTGLIPVEGERVAAPEHYGGDRLFAYLRLAPEADPAQDAAVAALARAGHPLLRFDIADRYDLGQEIFRWELATAVAGAELGINPFDQPDVEEAKLVARQLATDSEAGGELPEPAAIMRDGPLSLYADPDYTEELIGGLEPAPTLRQVLGAHLDRLQAGDYFALLAYLERSGAECAELLQTIRHRVRDGRRVATTLGYGPRYLHSTGQAHKGGPDTGVFLVLTRDPVADIPLPRRLSFGTVQKAQALADRRVLAGRGRRVLRLHLGADPMAGLRQLARWLG